MATNNSVNTFNVPLSFTSGTGSFNIGTAAVSKNVFIGNTTGSTSITIDSGSGSISIGTSIAKIITIGNTTGATAINIGSSSQSTGSIAFSSSASTSVQTLISGVNQYTLSASLMTFILPVTSNVGDILTIVGFGSGSWVLTQNSGQTIHSSTAVTTTGVTGTITPGNRYVSLQIICIIANTDWVLIGKNTGTLTFA